MNALPWLDRAGRFAPLRAVVFVLVLLPAVWLAVEATKGWLGSRPTTEAIHQAGLWAIRILAVSLAVTPLRVATRHANLISVRRMLGLAALAYAALHFGLYVYDQHFDLWKVGAEIVKRIYLLIGFVAFCGLLVLGVTSNDGMVRRLGAPLWNRLHKIVYGIGVLAVVHFFMQSKLDETQPFLLAGLCAVLALARLVKAWRRDLSLAATLVIAAAAGLLTALSEAAWYMVKTNAPFDLVLAANLDFSYTIRPAWFVLAGGLVLVVARLARPLVLKKTSGPARVRIVPNPSSAAASDCESEPASQPPSRKRASHYRSILPSRGSNSDAHH